MMEKRISYIFSLWLLMFLAPFLCTVLFQGKDIREGKATSTDTLYMAAWLSWQIEEHTPPEAMKAQAVIVRTNYENASKEERSYIYEEIMEKMDHRLLDYKQLEKMRISLDILKEVPEILTYNNEVVQIPFHKISNGRTRDGREVFREEKHAYLIAVESPWDQEAQDFGHRYFFQGKDFAQNIHIVETDQNGYVLMADVGGQIVSGEELRKKLQLVSSSFHIEKQEDGVQIYCEGIGHGLGLSQYGAASMANEGSSYINILTYYFPLLTLSQSI